MTERSLQVTYRKGKPFSAYLHLSHQTGEKSARTVPSEDGLLVVDYAQSGKAIGVEITCNAATNSSAELNRVRLASGSDARRVSALVLASASNASVPASTLVLRLALAQFQVSKVDSGVAIPILRNSLTGRNPRLSLV